MLSPWEAYGYKFQLVGDKPVGYFTNMAKDLNLGLQRTNPAGSQGRTWSWGLRITSSVPLNQSTTLPPTMGLCVLNHTKITLKHVYLVVLL